MSQLVLHIASRARVARHSAAETFATCANRTFKRFAREQTGQDMVEYAGVLLVVALIIAAVVASGLDTTVKNGISGLVNDILSGKKPAGASG